MGDLEGGTVANGRISVPLRITRVLFNARVEIVGSEVIDELGAYNRGAGRIAFERHLFQLSHLLADGD